MLHGARSRECRRQNSLSLVLCVRGHRATSFPHSLEHIPVRGYEHREESQYIYLTSHQREHRRPHPQKTFSPPRYPNTALRQHIPLPNYFLDTHTTCSSRCLFPQLVREQRDQQLHSSLQLPVPSSSADFFFPAL